MAYAITLTGISPMDKVIIQNICSPKSAPPYASPDQDAPDSLVVQPGIQGRFTVTFIPLLN
jgi:hypothetical protein